MSSNVFSPDFVTDRPLTITPGAVIESPRARLCAWPEERMCSAFADAITAGFVGDFEKSAALVAAGRADAIDRMAHVSTFHVQDGMIYVTYYANTKEPSEDPLNQTARLAYAPADASADLTVLDIQAAGDTIDGKPVEMVYDTILMPRDERTLYVLWTARVAGNYYRFYAPFDLPTKTLGAPRVNRFRVGEVTNDFSFSGIQSALSANGLPIKRMFSDIGIMQKLSSRVENGETWYYSGAYSGDFTCIIKSRDLITWEYVSQPDFPNNSKWENATYVSGDRVYYFVRQQDDDPCGFLTVYDLVTGQWEDPVLIEDCQSRSDFLEYKGELYLIHAPVDREHLGIVRIDREDIAKSQIVLQAKMDTSCFYPFWKEFGDAVGLSYTIARKHIRLAKFELEKFI